MFEGTIIFLSFLLFLLSFNAYNLQGGVACLQQRHKGARVPYLGATPVYG